MRDSYSGSGSVHGSSAIGFAYCTSLPNAFQNLNTYNYNSFILTCCEYFGNGRDPGKEIDHLYQTALAFM